MGTTEHGSTELDVVLKGFLALVHEGPTFIEKYRAAVLELDAEYEKKKHALDTIAEHLNRELEHVSQQVEHERTQMLAALKHDGESHRHIQIALQDDIRTLREDHARLSEALNAVKLAHQQEIAEHQEATAEVLRDRQRALDRINQQIEAARQQHAQVVQQHEAAKRELGSLVSKIGAL